MEIRIIQLAYGAELYEFTSIIPIYTNEIARLFLSLRTLNDY